MERTIGERVELHCHSEYSEQDGVSRIKDIIEFAAANNMPAVAITDHASVAGYGEAAYYGSHHEGLKVIYGMEAFVVNDLEPSVTGDKKYIMEAPSFHVTFLIKNEEGKQNLYELMSIAEERFKASKPRIPWSEIEKHREGLLIGSACEVGELYLAVMDEEPDETLDRIAAKYDYVEIQPAENKLYCIDNDEESYDEGLAYVQTYDKKVIEVGERLGKMVVATSDAHFVTKDEAIVRSVLQRHVGYADDHQLDIYFRTTEEMLQCFSYLGEEKAWEIVVENSNKIAGMIEAVQVLFKEKEHYPVLDYAYFRLQEICYEKLEEIYGDDVSQDILDQMNWELHSMMESGSDSIMLLAKELVEESGLSPYEFGYRGCLGGSLVAYLCGITCVNPLESKVPLYPEFLIGLDGDKFLDIDFNFPTQVRNELWEACSDLEDIGAAFHAGVIDFMSEDEAREAVDGYENYHKICFDDEKREWIIERLTYVTTGHHMSPGAVLIVPEDYGITEFTPLAKVTNRPMVTEIEYHNLDNLYWFDILTNTHINMIYQLINKTGVNVADISLDDSEVGMLLGGKGQISSLGIPEFDNEYARSAAKELGVESFTDVVQLVCLMHGTNAWANNAQELLRQENMSKDNIIASREDVFDCLLVLGFTREDAFEISEFVRKGKARSVDKKWQGYKSKMENAGAPDWFIDSCETVRYLFPRAHSYIYALHAWWTAWFKLHYPKEFYEVYMEIKASNGLKQIVSQGNSAFEIYKTGYWNAILDGFCNPYVSEVAEELAVVEEMFDVLCAK